MVNPWKSLSFSKMAAASNVYKNNVTVDASKAIDDNSTTKWVTNVKTTTGWLEVDLGTSMSISRAVIESGYPDRIQGFTVEYFENDRWKVCFTGEIIADLAEARFPPIIAQRVRLNITKNKGGIGVSEFQLFAK